MIVRLRQPKREIEVAGDRTVNQLLDSLGMNRESFLVIRNGTLAPGDARLDRLRRDRGPTGHLGGLSVTAVASKCRVCRQPAIIDLPRHNANFCGEHLLAAVPASGREGDRRSRHVVARRPRARRRQRRQGLTGRLGHPDRPRLPSRRAVPRPRDRRLQRRERRVRPPLRRRARVDPSHGRPSGRARVRRADRRQGHPPRAVLGLWIVEAAPLRPSRTRRRVRRGRHRTQPRRRSGRAVRQHTPLGRPVPGTATAGASGAATASRRRSSPWCGSPSARWRRGASCVASTTRSRSARWRPATSTWHTRPRSTRSSATLPDRRPRSTSTSSNDGAVAVRGRAFGRRRSARRARSAARRPPARSAPSAGSRSGWQVTTSGAGRGAAVEEAAHGRTAGGA